MNMWVFATVFVGLITISGATAIIIGRMIRQRDQQIPRDHPDRGPGWRD